jgi:flavin reductase (DIM6/NTAB) family NADH-FMN oxidoreductase RutF
MEPSEALRLLNSGPVVLASCRDGERVGIITLAWTMPVSGDPPMVAIAVSPRRFSHDLIRRSGEFAVNVPAADMIDAVWVCGTVSGRDADKFETAGLAPLPAREVGAPLVDGCIGHLECRVEQAVTAGDHTVFVGRVVAAGAEPGCLGDRGDRPERLQTLHHLGGRRFFTSAGALVEAGGRGR